MIIQTFFNSIKIYDQFDHLLFSNLFYKKFRKNNRFLVKEFKFKSIFNIYLKIHKILNIYV